MGLKKFPFNLLTLIKLCPRKTLHYISTIINFWGKNHRSNCRNNPHTLPLVDMNYNYYGFKLQ